MAKLYFKYGAMSCGKTTELLQVVHNYNRKGFTRRKIESHKSLTKFYCNMTRWKYIK